MPDYFDISLDDLGELIGLGGAITPDIYQYYKNLKNRKIVLNQGVDAEIVERMMIPLMEMDNDGTGEPIEIMLATTGGSVFDAMTLCDVIDNLKTPTTITCMTYAFSMGGIILMAGFNNPNVKKRCFKHSAALLHAGEDYLQGNAFSVKDTFHFLERYSDKIKEYTLSHSNISEEEYKAMERTEWYMTAEDMLKYGLVDEII